MASLLSFEQWPELVTFAVAVALAAIQKGWRSFRMAQSQTWPITYGRIVRSDAPEKNKTFGFKVVYSYRVGEESYQGEFEKNFRDEAEAHWWADALRDKQIPVHYDPEKPARTQLWESDLVPIVQSFPPPNRDVLRPAKPFPAWERLLVTAGIAVALAGCSLSLIELFGRLAGKPWITPTLSIALAVGAWVMAGLAALENKRTAARRAAPEWMAFALHALTYFVILSFLLFPLGKASRKTSRETRDVSYQILFYFSAFEAFYLRLKDAEEEHPSFAATYTQR
jgi:uncharacterized protein DUF3592